MSFIISIVIKNKLLIFAYQRTSYFFNFVHNQQLHTKHTTPTQLFYTQPTLHLQNNTQRTTCTPTYQHIAHQYIKTQHTIKTQYTTCISTHYTP